MAEDGNEENGRNTAGNQAVTTCACGGGRDETHSESQPQGGAHDERTHNGYLEDQKKVITRLSRIEGQIRGIKQMAQNGEYCIDILTQISAANSALKSVALLLLDDHLNHCVRQAAAEGGDVADEKLDEASAAIARLVRS